VIDVLVAVPPNGRSPRRQRTVFIGWEASDDPCAATYPVSILTLDGPWIEMVETNANSRRHGYAFTMLKFGAKFLGRALTATVTTGPESKRLLEKAKIAGICAQPTDKDTALCDE
jgi:hypothetical protein